MKLRLSRSQKQSGVMHKSVVFSLDARAELNPDEEEDVKKYELGKQVIYNSENARKRLSNADNSVDGSMMGFAKGFANLALAKLSLNITIDSLTKGHHIEAKSLDELIGAEEAIRQACENLKTYLAAAATFDGREEVVEY